MLLKLWAFLTGQQVVWLLDNDGTVTRTIARQTPFGLVAKRYWPFSIRDVLCEADGKIPNGCYVIQWKAE
jgi:hypothetical protein